MKILWQSSTAIHEYPAYTQAIKSHALDVLGEVVTLDVRGVPNGTSKLHFKAFDFLNNSLLFDSVVAAERQGYDAVAIGCFIDPILDELREIVDIPVMSLAQSAMHVACMVGKRFSVLSHNAPLNDKFYRELVEKYGLEKNAGPFISFDMPFDELERAMAGDAEPCLERIRQAGRQAISQGSDVLLLGCGLLNLVAIRNGLTQVDGATLVDASGVLMVLTQSMVTLRQVSGLQISRAGYFARPTPQEVDEVLGIYGRGKPVKNIPEAG